ncbi:MAG: hypothetical protein KGM16_02945 [Bacteroidota bacterium]|nr:hypothetical protein [Bacteroidota bacterium]
MKNKKCNYIAGDVGRKVNWNMLRNNSSDDRKPNKCPYYVIERQFKSD